MVKQKSLILAGLVGCLAGAPLAPISTPALAIDFAGQTIE